MSLEEELPPQDDKWPLDANAVDDGLKARYKPPANAKAARLAKPYALEYIHCPLAPDGSVPTDGLNEDGRLFRLIDQILQHYESGGRGRSAKGTVLLGQGEVADVLVDDAPEWGGGGSSGGSGGGSGGGGGGWWRPAKDATNAAATIPSTPPIIYVHGGNGRGAPVSACLLSLFNPTLSASRSAVAVRKADEPRATPARRVRRFSAHVAALAEIARVDGTHVRSCLTSGVGAQNDAQRPLRVFKG